MISEQKAKEMEEHRHELSQNLHDGVLQNLVALNASLETQLLKKEDDGQINSQIHFIRNSINELRLLCGILRLDDDVPFEESIQHSLDAFRQTYGLSIKLGLACDTSIFTSVQKEHLLRILYESLSNSANHSDAKNILVTIADDGSGKYYFTIRDDGTKQTQTNSDSKNITHGLGLKSIKARAEKLGGHAEFTQDEDGWTVRVVF